jgi:2-C-methyl-D-erythritol 4-phosphate cytidylyltransferase
MGTAIPKQYLDLAGIPLLARTLLIFQEHPLIDRIVATVPAGDEDYRMSSIVAPFGLDKVFRIVAGGPTRQASVYNGLKALSGSKLVAIHDGARPLVAPDLVARTIEIAGLTGAAIAAAPVRETVKRMVRGNLETVPRADLWLAHTPQTFETELIVAAHKKAIKESFDGTDDSALVERLPHPVAVVEDSEDNLKITTPSDLARAARIIRMR